MSVASHFVNMYFFECLRKFSDALFMTIIKRRRPDGRLLFISILNELVAGNGVVGNRLALLVDETSAHLCHTDTIDGTSAENVLTLVEGDSL